MRSTPPDHQAPEQPYLVRADEVPGVPGPSQIDLRHGAEPTEVGVGEVCDLSIHKDLAVLERSSQWP